MKIKKKFLKLIYFINVFNAFKDSDTLVDIDETKFNTLKEFVEETNINDSFQNLLNKCDYDNDGIISIIDLTIMLAFAQHVIDDSDPKYDPINGTYNGKSLDLNNDDDDGDIADLVMITNTVGNTIRKYIAGYITFDYNNLENDIISYYENHNYTWPTLQQLKYFNDNESWE